MLCPHKDFIVREVSKHVPCGPIVSTSNYSFNFRPFGEVFGA